MNKDLKEIFIYNGRRRLRNVDATPCYSFTSKGCATILDVQAISR